VEDFRVKRKDFKVKAALNFKVKAAVNLKVKSMS